MKTSNSYPIEVARDTLAKELPGGFLDLWNALPEGSTTFGSAFDGLLRENQEAIVKGAAVLEQQLVTAAGARWGLRPEIFDRLRGLPGADVLGEAARQIVAQNLDFGDLARVGAEAVTETLARVLEKTGVANNIQNAIADYGGAVVAVAQIVIGMVTTIVRAEKEYKQDRRMAAIGALDCKPVAFSAFFDKTTAEEGLSRVMNGDMRDLFMPECKPFKYDRNLNSSLLLGFTCCQTTATSDLNPDHDDYVNLGGRMIAPVGAGVGNRIQSAFGAESMIEDEYGGGPNEWHPDYYGGDKNGFGCLPMCPRLRVHRAIIVSGGRTHDPGRDLPSVASLGEEAWRLLWACGPATYSVDGDEIAAAWSNYLSVMRDQIARNQPGFGTHMAPGRAVCDSWDQAGRSAALRWFFERIGVDEPERAASPDGIYIFNDAAPVREWKRFAELQAALLDTKMITTVDARTCAKQWRERVAAAQREWLELDGVCSIDVETIPDPTYRAAVVEAKRRKGARCFAVGTDVAQNIAAAMPVSATSGPSLITFRGTAPTMPMLNTQPSRSELGRSSGDSSDGLLMLLLLGGGIGLGALALRNRRKRRR